MFKVRDVTSSDLELIQEIHNHYYPKLDFPDFTRLLNGFIIEDEDDDELITAGGVEMMAEAFLVTNLGNTRVKIGRALKIAQDICAYTCQKFRIRDLHAFTSNPEYARHLIKHGFETRGEQALRMRIPNGKHQHTNFNH